MPPAEPAKKKSKVGLIIALLVVVLLIAGGAVAFLVSGSSSSATATLTTCKIDADGTLTASGGLSGDAKKVTVEFRNTDGNQQVDSDSVTASGGKWTATGSAPDDVQRVTCVVAKIGD
jgi:flagellar basal body-associated protein FliL